jgi:(4S)-4-hydroxy-5-phosphonooxypentane-2,3-dione isomerase
MYHVCVVCKVKPGQGENYLAALTKNRNGSLQEPGCVQWDVLRQVTPPQEGEAEIETKTEIETFFLYEVYQDEEAFKFHQQTAHYLAFREAVEEMQAAPRQGSRYVTALA